MKVFLKEKLRKSRSVLFLTMALFISMTGIGQDVDSLPQHAGLPELIRFALKNQPLVEQSEIDERNTQLAIRSKLSEWFPQVNFGYQYQHNFKVQTANIGGNLVRLGVNNTSSLNFTASQTLFDRDLLLAGRTKTMVGRQASQQTENVRIDLVVNVSRAYYDLLATQQQLEVVNENILRIEKSLGDARARYDAGVADKTDYKRATIALNNAHALRKANQESLKAKEARLKSLINYPPDQTINLVYDSIALENELYVDTLQTLQYSNRIEYRILQTQRNLQESNLRYHKWSFIPSLSATGAYNFNFLNNEFSKLYNQSFPYSYAGLSLAFPIFQGGKRKFDIQQAQWMLKRTELELSRIQNILYAEFTSSLALYKTSLADFMAYKENVGLAREVYDVINRQYLAGIKNYLEVVIAESDLRTAQLNYFDALYRVLSSRAELQRSLGTVDIPTY